MLDGSRIERGRKNRKNIKKHVVRNPATLAQTIRRRILLTGGSGLLSTISPIAFGVGFAAAGVAGGFACVLPMTEDPAAVATLVVSLGARSGLTCESTRQTSVASKTASKRDR